MVDVGKLKRRMLPAAALLLMALVGTASGAAIAETVNKETEARPALINDGVTTYAEWLDTQPVDQARSDLDRVEVSAVHYANVSSEAAFQVAGDQLIWSESETEDWAEWEINVAQDGLYNIGLVYASANDSGLDIVRKLEIDGASPYAEAERIVLKRQFADEAYPPLRDEFDNDIRPRSVERKDWQDALLTDYSADTEPLLWRLTAGKHTIRLLSDREPITLKSLYIAAPIRTPDYQAYKAAMPADTTEGDWISIYEAEHSAAKSNTSLTLQSIDASLISPPTDGSVRYNTIGGEQFRSSGEWIEWDFEVPHDGVYHIGFKFLQAYINNSYAHRTIEIDGTSPFAELRRAAFPYNTKWSWSGMTLSDEQDAPYDIYLTKGAHRLRMTVTAAPVKGAYDRLLAGIDLAGTLEQKIRKVTGNFERSGANADVNRDWQLEKYIPDLGDQLSNIIEQLNDLADEMRSLTTGSSEMESAIRLAVRDFIRMKSNPRDIPGSLADFTNLRQNLGFWAYRMLDQPLLLDYFWVAEPGAKLPKAAPGFLDSIGHSLKGFFTSFTVDYDFRRNNPKAIDVWVNRSRDYVNLIQQLADEDFTAKTGIAVNVNIVPDPQLFVLGNIAGIQPDVALGVDQTLPVDLATRGALTKLNAFPGYAETASQFLPGALRALHYDQDDYGLPETQSFNLLVYRTDILDSLGIEPPRTWDDLVKVLPSLQQNGYDFYLPPSDYSPFILQNGGSYYTDDGMQSALGTEAAFKGFQQWTDMFNLYQLPKEVPSFYTHFRMGDIPIGVVDYNTYLQIQFGAPELTGKWKVATIPGTAQSDGKIARWSGGALFAGVIFKASQKQEHAWAFLQWWVSAQTQTRFGNEIEAMYGPEYRWNTANQQAFRQLPWPKDQLPVMLEQLGWYQEIPQLPGGYFTGRQMDFAWIDVVGSRKNAREALRKAVDEINREMVRKQIEFGLRNREARIVRTLDVLPLNEHQEE
ncbi:extracellular solute-binding protein [Cohnella hashimotonis]|uniref:Extracellular solute-binding protein n=1 Tax=Cohnella hashimotonis TaxID=2826895 RepID=A0ABT6TS10_9BACL|nr:extracellular solute-binding protein [Cohnella hashimotonis]MDI4649013.1 extracellular solute-binding protein [Cohnella hashimotonis]